MLKLFKDLTIEYFIFAFVGAIAILLFGAIISPDITLVYFIPAIIYIFGCAIFFISKAAKRYSNIVDIMQMNCQCRQFIEENNKLMQKSMKLNPTIKATLDLNVTTAYFNMGCFDEFLSKISTINTDNIKGNRAKTNIKFLYTNNLAAYNIQIGSLEAAQQYIAQLKELADKVNSNLAEHDKMIRSIERLNGKIYIANGEYEKAEAIYLHGSEYALNNITKVCSNFYLGEIYSHTQRIEKAKAAYEYVIQNGGDLFHVKTAKKAIKAL